MVLSDLLNPRWLLTFSQTCGTLRHTLEALAAELKRTHGAVRALLAKCGATLPEMRAQPRYLNWSRRGLDADDCTSLSLLAASGSFVTNLEGLYLSHNQIGVKGMVALSAATMAKLERLYLSRNKIGDGGMQAFASAVASGSLGSLMELGLFSNQIGDAGMVVFAEALKLLRRPPWGRWRSSSSSTCSTMRSATLA